MKNNMEQNLNNRGNGYGNNQNRNNFVNNNQGQNAPEVVNCAQSGKGMLSTITHHISENKTAYKCGVGAVTAVALAGFGILAYKKGWFGLNKKAAKEKKPAEQEAAATATEPKPASKADSK
jgi:uncharacterized membrane protein YebE (DUF533 family)